MWEIPNNPMQRLTCKLYWLLICCLFSCQSVEFTDTANICNVQVSVTNSDGWSTRNSASCNSATRSLNSATSRLTFAVYSDGERIAYDSQTNDAADYGTWSTYLDEGDYNVVAIAHSGSSNPTTTNPEKVTFSGGVTDTYLATDSLVVTEEGAQVALTAKRVVARIIVQLTDTILPPSVKRLKFYYTGGSSTLNVLTGFGSVQSKQTEYRDVSADNAYTLYTFPHSPDDELTLTITAQDANGQSVITRKIEGVAVGRNRTTTLTGSLTGNSSGTSAAVQIDETWGETISQTF